MKINRIFSNQGSFKSFSLDEKFNIILADTATKSTELDSRNGLGKSLLLDVVGFCLGSGTPSKLNKKELDGWTFGVDITIKGNDYKIERTIGNSGKLTVRGDVSGWPVEVEDNQIKQDDFNYAMGQLVFDLDPEESAKKYRPKFRGLISYFMRNDKTAFVSPFKYFSSQSAWYTQALNAYLLGLNWKYASDLQLLLKRKEALQSFNEAAQEGVLEEFSGSVGELEAERVKISSKLSQMEERLKNFKVHEQYFDLQEEANKLTRAIHKILDDININEQSIKHYHESLRDEADISSEEVESIYEDVGVHFPERLAKTLEEVRQFHKTVVENRQSYLKEEVDRLSRLTKGSKEEVGNLSKQKEEIMKTLQSHGALEEYSQLQKLASIEEQKLEEVSTRINRLNELADNLSDLSVEIEQTTRAMRQDSQERRKLIDNSIRIFNANSEALYSRPGTLTIDVASSGYKFKVEIERADSDGVENMKVFCYDLMLAELWASLYDTPVTLFHDSRLFDGVDERQIAKALELAKLKSDKFGFQYICTMNSDVVPHSKFTQEFKKNLDKYVKLTLDDNEDGSGTLLGKWV